MKYDYKFVGVYEIYISDLEDEINKLAKEGYKVVSDVKKVLRKGDYYYFVLMEKGLSSDSKNAMKINIDKDGKVTGDTKQYTDC